jgi:type I restriction enzyme, S subunit
MTKLLFDNFELFLNAPNGIKKLRELILKLAVQGKLVPQNPEDEPASELLKKIKAEKAKLIKEGKIKKEKPVEDIEFNNKYEIPDGWSLCKLQKCSLIIMGQSPESKYYNNKEKGLPFYQGKTEFGDMYPTPRKWCSLPQKIAKKGNILLSVRAPVGPTNICIEKSCIGRGLAAISTLNVYENRYLLYFFRSNENNLAQLGTGSTFKSISLKVIRNIIIPLPPLAEQKRIVEKVDSLMTFCDDLEKLKAERDKKRLSLNKASLNALLNSEDEEHFQKNWNHIVKNFDLLFSTPENVKELKQAILQLAVMGKLVPQNPDDEPASELLKKIKAEKERLIKEGKIKKQKPLPKITEDEIPFKLPGGWIWCRLGDAGIINPRNDAEDELEASFVPMRYIFSEYSKRIITETNSWGEIRKGFTHFAENDVSVAKITPCFENGKSAVMEGLENDIGAGTTELHIFRPVNSYVISRYVLIYFKTSNFIESGKTKMTGSAGQKRIPREYITNALFSLPPVKEQKRVVEKVDSLMVLCDELEKNLTQGTDKSEKLVNALVNDISNL